jgi:hypothetical protein
LVPGDAAAAAGNDATTHLATQMLARRLLFVHQRSRSRLARIYAALLSLASLGLAGFAAVHWQEPPQPSTERSSPPPAEVRPVDGIVGVPSQGRAMGTRKRWM